MGFLSKLDDKISSWDEQKRKIDFDTTSKQVEKVVGWKPTACTPSLGSVELVFAADDNSNSFAVFKVLFSFKLVATFKYEDILSAEIRVGKQVTTTKKSISATGAIAGGVIGGGVGAVIGGIGLGKSESRRSLSDISIHVLLRNCEKVSVDIPCNSIKEAQAGMDLISLAIDKADRDYQSTHTPESPHTPQPQSPQDSKSKIQELKDLSELLKQGLVTEEEFTKLKEEIMKK